MPQPAGGPRRGVLFCLLAFVLSAALFLFTWSPPVSGPPPTTFDSLPAVVSATNSRGADAREATVQPVPTLGKSEQQPLSPATFAPLSTASGETIQTADPVVEGVPASPTSALSAPSETQATPSAAVPSSAASPLCAIPWHEQRFVGWERRLRRATIRGAADAEAALEEEKNLKIGPSSAVAAAVGRNPTLCALTADPFLSPGQAADGCDWVLPREEAARRRAVLRGLSGANAPHTAGAYADVETVEAAAEGSDGNAKVTVIDTFLHPHTLTSSRPSVSIRTTMSEFTETLRVARRPTGGDSPAAAAAAGPPQAEPQTCTLPHVDPPRCAAETSVLFIGHSHTRFLASLHCMMVRGAACHRYDQHSNDYVLVTADEGAEALTAPTSGSGGKEGAAPSPLTPSSSQQRPIRSLYVQANLEVSHRLKYVREAIEDFVAKTRTDGEEGGGEQQQRQQQLSPAKTATRARLVAALGDNKTFASLFTHIVVSKGAWEAGNYDRRPNATALEMEASLTALRAAFPSARIIVHMLHGYVPNKDIAHVKRPSKTRKLRQWHRNVCFARERLEKIRLAMLCGAERFAAAEVARASTLEGQASAAVGVEIFDTMAETLDPAAAGYADGLGHHFTDLALEGIIQKLLFNHVCPPTPSPSPTSSSSDGAAAASTAAMRLERLRRFIDEGVPSVDPSKQRAPRRLPNDPFPSLADAYRDGSATEGVVGAGAKKPSSVACGLVEAMSASYVHEPRCGCLRDRFAGDPFCASSGIRASLLSRLGDQVDNNDD